MEGKPEITRTQTEFTKIMSIWTNLAFFTGGITHFRYKNAVNLVYLDFIKLYYKSLLLCTIGQMDNLGEYDLKSWRV